MSSCLFECLKEAGLERYYTPIRRQGYETAYSLLYMPPAELRNVGITTDSDRQKFLQLVQIIASFHQGGKFSPRRVISPPRNRTQSKISGRPTTTVKGVEHLTISMANSVVLGYHSSDSSSTSQEYRSDYKLSPRIENKARVTSQVSTKRNLPSDMELPIPTSPTKHRRQQRKKAMNGYGTVDASKPTRKTPVAMSRGSIEDHLQPEVSAATLKPVECERANRKESIDDYLTTKSVTMSTESLKVHKVLRTSGYNYGLPRESPQQRAGAINNTKVVNMFSSPTSQRTRQSSNNASSRPKITVCVRKRPLLQSERRNGGFDVITCNNENGGKEGDLVVHELKHAVDMAEFIQQNVFQFDKVFTEQKTNQDIYEEALKPMVDWIMTKEGRATCFGYGQTGAGKTHTLLGDEAESGVFFHAAKDILSRLSAQMKRQNQGKRACTLSISLYEIYCSRIFDLLNNHRRLQALEDSNKQVHIHGLRSVMVQTMNDLQEVVHKGLGERSIGVTGANQDSSRSHAIVQLSIKDAKGAELSRLSFIDLAGSERACDALRDSDKRNRLEGAEINQSLLALKECIRSLDLALAHTPFRQSKLTQVLRDSFMGNSRTCMIANISPSHASLEHTMNTLRYASRVKELHHRPSSTPQQRRNRARVLSAKTSRHRPFTADPTYSQLRPSPASKPRRHISRSVSVDTSIKVMDYAEAFSGHGRELTRTPPPNVSRSLSIEATAESCELPNESENIRLSTDISFTGTDSEVESKQSTKILKVTSQDSSDDSRRGEVGEKPPTDLDNATAGASHQQRYTMEKSRQNSNNGIGGNRSSFNRYPDARLTNTRSGRTTERNRISNSNFQNREKINGFASATIKPGSSYLKMQTLNSTEVSSKTDTEPAVLGESSKNPNLPSPKKFLTFLKGKQSLKTRALRQQLKKARHRANSEHCGSEEESHSDQSANSNSSTGPISTSHSNLTSNVQQHHQQRIFQSDTNHPGAIINNNVTTPPLPSPKLDHSEPRRSSRISSRSASPGTGGRTTPDERQCSAGANPSTKVGLTSATELRARLAAAAAALNSPNDDGDTGKVSKRDKMLPTSSSAVPKVSSSSDKENNDTNSEIAKVDGNETVYRAQSEVIIAHQEHISEILRISIEEESLYHNLREHWDKGTSFETYTRSLLKLLTKKTQSIEALKVQLTLYDRVREAYKSS